jgi:hypothetical protein
MFSKRRDILYRKLPFLVSKITPIPDKLETREAEAGMRNGRGEADLGAQGRDHEGPRVEHGAGAERASIVDTGTIVKRKDTGVSR